MSCHQKIGPYFLSLRLNWNNEIFAGIMEEWNTGILCIENKIQFFPFFHYSTNPLFQYSNVYWFQLIGGLNLRSLSAFETTVTDESAMAPAAKIGLRRMPKNGKRTPAATGMRIVLYAKAQKRFCLIFRMVASLKEM